MFGKAKNRRVPRAGAPDPPRVPPPVIYRRFLYLDVESVLDFLSVLQGGEVLERYQSSVAESGGDLGGQIGLEALGIPLGVRAGWRRAAKLEEKVRMTTTAHAAVAAILRALEDSGERNLLTAPSDLAKVTVENSLVEMPYRSLLGLDPLDPRPEHDDRGWFERLTSRKTLKPAEPFVARIKTGCADWGAVLAGDGACLRVPTYEFRTLRQATVLGQVEIARGGEEVDVREGEGGFVASIVDRGLPVTDGEEVVNGLVLRPLCIYK